MTQIAWCFESGSSWGKPIARTDLTKKTGSIHVSEKHRGSGYECSYVQADFLWETKASSVLFLATLLRKTVHSYGCAYKTKIVCIFGFVVYQSMSVMPNKAFDDKNTWQVGQRQALWIRNLPGQIGFKKQFMSAYYIFLLFYMIIKLSNRWATSQQSENKETNQQLNLRYFASQNHETGIEWMQYSWG